MVRAQRLNVADLAELFGDDYPGSQSLPAWDAILLAASEMNVGAPDPPDPGDDS